MKCCCSLLAYLYFTLKANLSCKRKFKEDGKLGKFCFDFLSFSFLPLEHFKKHCQLWAFCGLKFRDVKFNKYKFMESSQTTLLYTIYKQASSSFSPFLQLYPLHSILSLQSTRSKTELQQLTQDVVEEIAVVVVRLKSLLQSGAPLQ